jgi:hypothetical protein
MIHLPRKNMNESNFLSCFSDFDDLQSLHNQNFGDFRIWILDFKYFRFSPIFFYRGFLCFVTVSRFLYFLYVLYVLHVFKSERSFMQNGDICKANSGEVEMFNRTWPMLVEFTSELNILSRK